MSPSASRRWRAAAPGRFTWFNSADVAKPDAEQVLTQAVKAGAQGFGEMKYHVAADGPDAGGCMRWRPNCACRS